MSESDTLSKNFDSVVKRLNHILNGARAVPSCGGLCLRSHVHEPALEQDAGDHQRAEGEVELRGALVRVLHAALLRRRGQVPRQQLS